MGFTVNVKLANLVPYAVERFLQSIGEDPPTQLAYRQMPLAQWLLP